MSIWSLLMLVSCSSEPLSDLARDWRDEVIYAIVVDRFDNADYANDQIGEVATVPGDLARHQGGDWAGLTRRLPYLSRLGVTTIWISPIVENLDRTPEQDGYHGYWASDFTSVNPRFGALEDLQQLVEEAHARGIKVIIDVVVNHTGRLFYYDLDADGVQDEGELYPPFSAEGAIDAPVVWLTDPPRLFLGEHNVERIDLSVEHFHRRGQTTDYVEHQMELGDFPTGLRDLDTENEEVVQGLVDTYLRWVLLTDVDGFRLDAAPHVPRTFWRKFCTRLRTRLNAAGVSSFLLLGEVFHPDPEVLSSYTTPGQFDAVFDFSLKWDLIDAVLLDGAPAAQAQEVLKSNRSYYPSEPQEAGIGLDPWTARVTFVDNHDTWRINAEIEDPRVTMLALVTLFTVDGIPALYYGTEHGFVGRGGDGSRERLWRTGFVEEGFYFELIQHLAELRRELVALRRGDLVVRYASEASGRDPTAPSDAGLLAWERHYDGERVLVVMNAHAQHTARATVSTGFEEGTELFDALDPAASYETRSNGVLDLVLAPRTARILLPK